MTKAETLSVKIPFSGFYESTHDSNIDRAIEQYFDREGDGGDHTPNDFYWSFDRHRVIRNEYAKLYADSFLYWFNSETGLKLDGVFEEMTSPREYNFETDRLFVSIPLKQLKALKAYVPNDVLEKHIKRRCTSYDGFCSFYSNDFADWQAKPFAKWDHNELGILIEAAMIHADIEEDHDFTIMEHALCNGGIDNIVYPYLDEWAALHPVETISQHVQEFFDIPDSDWEAMSEEEREVQAKEYVKEAYRCDQTADLFKELKP